MRLPLKKTHLERIKNALKHIGLSGKEYMLTAKVYDAIKSDVEYTQDTVIRYVKAWFPRRNHLAKDNIDTLSRPLHIFKPL